MNEYKMVVFENKKIRRSWYGEEWYFSVIDIINVLEVSFRARKYWADLKVKLIEEGFEVSDKIGQLKMLAEDGKSRFTDCANTESMFRIIQSIPSKKAEPFKRWLARVGYERVQEIENPELAQERMKMLYEEKGYPKDWIDKRLRGIAIRQNLTDEWKDRGIRENKDYAIPSQIYSYHWLGHAVLTNEISKATFGVSIGEYKELKNLDRENLRDHMDELELIFGYPHEFMIQFKFGWGSPMLGEKVTTEITISKNSEGFAECAVAAKQGGDVAGNARREAEEKIGRSVVSEDNFLSVSEGKLKELEKKKKIKVEVGDEK